MQTESSSAQPQSAQAIDSIFSGSPEHAVAHEQSQTPPAAAPATPEPKTEIWVGGKKFNNQDELIAHMSKQEERLNSVESMISRASAPQNQPRQVNPADLVFEDPVAAFALAEERAEQRISKKLQEKETVDRAWSKFYTDNPDLSQFQPLVKAAMMELNTDSSNANLPMDQLLVKLATKTRSYMEMARKAGGGTQERALPSGAAVTAGASSGKAPVITTPAISLSFSDQVKNFQRRGKK